MARKKRDDMSDPLSEDMLVNRQKPVSQPEIDDTSDEEPDEAVAFGFEDQKEDTSDSDDFDLDDLEELEADADLDYENEEQEDE